MVSAAPWVFMLTGTGTGLRNQKIVDRDLEIRRQKIIVTTKIRENQEKEEQEREDMEVWELLCQVHVYCVNVSFNHTFNHIIQSTGRRSEKSTQDCAP